VGIVVEKAGASEGDRALAVDYLTRNER